MEITPRYLREDAEFRMSVRGYNQGDVDDLLDQVADVIEEIQERLRQATERAARAEQRAAEGAETEEALRRTLVLAQRTADLTLQEARESAAQMLKEAETKAASIVADAETAARREAEEGQRALRHDISVLEQARAVLQGDVAALEGFLARERSRLTEMFTDQLSRLETAAGAGLRPPELHDVEVPPTPVPAEPAARVEVEVDVDAPFASEPESEAAMPALGEDSGSLTGEAPGDDIVDGRTGDDELTQAWGPNDEDPGENEVDVRDDAPDRTDPFAELRSVTGANSDELDEEGGFFDQDADRDLDLGDRPRRGLRRRW